MELTADGRGRTIIDTGLVVMGRWRADSPEAQRAAIDAAAGWTAIAWPEGLQSYTALAGEDGATVLHLSRWRDEAAVRGFTGQAKARWTAVVDEDVPGLAKLGVDTYRYHNGMRFASGELGCLVLVDIDAGDADAARRWVDAMITAGRAEGPAPGMLAANFFLGARGTKILNVAEWVNAAAHQALIDRPRSHASRGRFIDADEARPIGFTRSNLWRSISSQPDGR